MMLSDIRDYVESLGITESVYMGTLDTKAECSIGVYNSKHQHTYTTAIGGHKLKSYGVKYVSFLVHWNKSPRDTEKAAMDLFNAVMETREVTVNQKQIKFIQLLVDEPVDVGTDDAGICEKVIEAAVIYGKGA